MVHCSCAAHERLDSPKWIYFHLIQQDMEPKTYCLKQIVSDCRSGHVGIPSGNYWNESAVFRVKNEFGTCSAPSTADSASLAS